MNPGGSVKDRIGLSMIEAAGAILHASCIAARQLGTGKHVLAILPDTGERYLSTDWGFIGVAVKPCLQSIAGVRYWNRRCL